MGALRWIGWGTLAFLVAVFVAWHAPRYLTLNANTFFELQRDVYVAHLPGIITHITASMLALMIGPLQFLSWFRTRHLTVHRWLGRTYVLSVVVGASLASTWPGCRMAGCRPTSRLLRWQSGGARRRWWRTATSAPGAWRRTVAG